MFSKLISTTVLKKTYNFGTNCRLLHVIKINGRCSFKLSSRQNKNFVFVLWASASSSPWFPCGAVCSSEEILNR